jgi:hypothetical protein
VTIDSGTLQNVLFDGGFGVNKIIEEERVRLKLPVLQVAPYGLRMVDQTVVEQVGTLRSTFMAFHIPSP